MSRLPIPGHDNGTWGQILNDFLSTEHNEDGSLKQEGSIAAKADNAKVVHTTGNEMIAGTKTFTASPVVPTPTLGSQAANKTYVDTTIASGASDATFTNKGIVQLAGDLAGKGSMAAAPVITDGAITNSKLAEQAITGNKIANTTITDANISANAAIAKNKLAYLQIGDNDINTISESKITNLVSDLAAKTPTTRQIIAGTGLTGGGDLSADRTLAVTYGTTAGTAMQGNDSRVASAVQASMATAKGDLFAATAASTLTRLGVGTNGQVLTADSTQGTGLKWAALPSNSSYVQKGDLVFNVKDYGAMGDGATDDTAAINSAISAATNGGTIYLPPGTYVVNPATGINLANNTRLTGSGTGSIIKVASHANATGNVVKAQSISSVSVDNLMIDGNKTNQTNSTNYGLYFGTVTNGTVYNVWVQNFTGVGIHIYNSTGVKVLDNFSTANGYHGFECEQSTASTWQGNRAWNNTLHGIIINPGEVGSTGSSSISLVGNICDSNSQYGIAVGIANGGLGQRLTKDCVISNNIIRNNAQYGIQIYQQNGFLISNNEITGNGFFGIYLYQTRYNQIIGNNFHNNSQASNGGYDEIFMEGNGSGYASTNNLIANNTILIDGAIKSRWGINEATSNDGPNTIVNNIIPNPGTSGTLNSIVASDVLTDPAGVHQVYGGNAISGANAGIDNAFNIMRLYSNLPNSDVQVVSTGGTIHMYAGGNDNLDVNSTAARAAASTATTAGGAIGLQLGASPSLGLYFGSGAPTVSAPKGSLYLRTDGSSTSSRAYINTDGSTSWTNLVTGA